MDDIAALLAEAIARRVKDAQAAKKAAPAAGGYAGTAAPKAVAPAAVAPKPVAPKAAAPQPPPRPAPPAAPANPVASADDVFALAAAADAPSGSVLLNAFRGPGSFLTAFVLHEALGKPVALRDDGPHF